MQDKTDATLINTALREVEEEIGLNRNLVQVLGELPPIPSGVTESIYNKIQFDNWYKNNH